MSSNQPSSRVAKNNSQRRRNGKPRRKLSLWEKIFICILAIFNIALISGALLFFSYVRTAPTISESQLASTNSTEILDSKGNVIWQMGTQKRDYATAKEIPDQLKESVVAIEDRRFYKHGGLDIRRIFGALFANLTGSSLGLQGGSTLTQQLVKLSVFSTSTADRTLKRKAQEAWLAIQVSRKYSRNQILTFYINKVYMGEGVYGMKTAAKYYFGKSLDKLSIDQYALLAGMPQSPVTYDPLVNPRYAKERRDTVLAAMVKNKKLTQAQATHYQNVPISHGLIKSHHNLTGSSDTKTQKIVDGYASSVITQLRKLGYKPESAGLKIYTYLNLKLQKRAYSVVNSNKYVSFPSKNFQVGLTMTDPNNGHVVAQIGGRKTTNILGLNRATQTNRSAGSTVKPLVAYGPAIEYLNWPTYYNLNDSKYYYPGTNQQVTDFEGSYAGNMTMRQALISSRNVPAVKTLATVGTTKASAFLSRFGINTNLYASSALGINLSTDQEAAAYGAFSTGGVYHTSQMIKKIVQQDGKTRTFKSKSKRVMKKSTAYMLTDMMKDVMTSSSGTGKVGHVSGTFEAGKTGTVGYDSKVNVPTGAVSDRWFTGYNRNYVLSIWTGYDQPNKAGNYISPGYNSQIPLYIYKSIMGYAMLGKTSRDWKMPSSVSAVTINGQRELLLTNASWSGGNASSTSTSSYTSSSSVFSSSTSQTTSSEDSSSNSSSSAEDSSSSSSAEDSTSTSSEDNTSNTSDNSNATPSSSENTSEDSNPSDKKTSSDTDKSSSNSDNSDE